ncbi:YgdB family protein [Brenneria tiliae]|uniref:YgdB family protein n=1 Tax=Brenneria tiliae TaxID=2914984 RepID=A0ABT0MT06_9GAMM|nr:YgdB family protein [Brenneria tiliae]MCL2892990.1 YgdB family protein [Brenneria tiliae]
MNKAWQSGGSTLTMVMLLSIVGLLLLSGLQRQLDAAIQTGSDERHYLRAFNQALSSLNWGMSLRWRDAEEGWQCQALAPEALRACLKKASGEAQWLLRGEGRLPAQPRPLALYRRVIFLTPASENGTLQPLSQGWLDFCPDRESARCADAQ